MKDRKPKSATASKARSPVAATKPQHRTTTARPLPKAAMQAIEQGVAAGEELLNVSLALTAADEIQSLIQEKIESFRSPTLKMRDANHATVALATLWGQVLCQSHGWRWAMVRDETGEAAGLISPDGAYVIMVHPWFFMQLAHGGCGPTSLELCRMITSGDLPPSKPDSYLVLR